MNWFYESNGEQKGPVSEYELDDLIARGVVLPTTLVWRDGLPNWQPLAQARVSGPPPMPGVGTAQCDSCGRLFAPSDVVQIAGRNICASCKPAVLQGLQQGTGYGTVGELARTGPAWEARETLGFFPAVWQTAKYVLTEPSRTFATMRVTGGLATPFWYNFVTACAGLVVGLPLAFLQFSMNPVFKQPDSPFNAMFGASFIVALVVFILFWLAVGMFIFGGMVHLSLMICGGARRPFEATFRALCYGKGSISLLQMIPVIGGLAALPWSLIVYSIGLARTHEIETWRAVLALFLPSLVCCGLIIVVVAFAVSIGGAQNMR